MRTQDNITIFGDEIIDEKTKAQLVNCVGPEDLGVLTADAHYGYGHPVGGAVAYKEHISLSGVGFDIGCGNMAVKTPLKSSDIDISWVMDQIMLNIGFGLGRPNPRPVEHEIFDGIAECGIPQVTKMLAQARPQLGTVGGGNHYVDVFKDEEGFVWVGVHLGSRGFGHKVASGYMALAKGLGFEDKFSEGGMDAPPILLNLHSNLGRQYIEAMTLAGHYAEAGRETVIKTVLNILGTKEVLESVHNHHNFAWMEEHFGHQYCVVRKGCTPAFPGQKGFVGVNMMDDSVILEGADSEASKRSLYSTVHGAGRVLSRRAAAGKFKFRGGERVQTEPGLIDFLEVRNTMRRKKIELRGADADEAPQAYKVLKDVLGHMGDTVKVLHTLTPIGVAMAGPDVHDPFKD